MTMIFIQTSDPARSTMSAESCSGRPYHFGNTHTHHHQATAQPVPHIPLKSINLIPKLHLNPQHHSTPEYHPKNTHTLMSRTRRLLVEFSGQVLLSHGGRRMEPVLLSQYGSEVFHCDDIQPRLAQRPPALHVPAVTPELGQHKHHMLAVLALLRGHRPACHPLLQLVCLL